jgi:hypothetical protein
VIILLSGFLSAAAYADRDGKRDHDRRDRSGYDHRRHDNRDVKRHQPSKQFRLDDRYRHDHYYPRRGYVVKQLPERRHHFHHRDRDYFFYSGIWYRPLGRRFVVTAPPVGIVISALPAFYTTLWISGIPYYYANDVYYVWRPDLDGYEVTEPPADLDEREPSILSDELFIYPKQGQSEQQQADDRYACHRWSVDETDYDPTQPPEDLGVSELRDLRDAYQRAMRACLEGRGYSAR